MISLSSGLSAQTAEQKAENIVKQLTLDEKIDLMSGASMMGTHSIPRLSIPSFLMTDGPVGAHIPQPSTAVGGGIGLAASWDIDLARATGVQLGRDARSRGAHFLLGPGVNIYRTPLNGRNFEYFGEDPFLASRITVGYILGVQSQGVAATVKHYLGNNSEYARHTSDSLIDEHTMREIYLPASEAAVKEAGAGAVMCSYNLTNSMRMCENGPLLSDVLKKDFGFSGLLMSDWFAVDDGVKAVNGGLDLEMPFGIHVNEQSLLPALKAGTIKEQTIDEHVQRLLATAYRFNWLERPQLDLRISRFNMAGDAIALKNAEEGTVLLKNSGVLPIPPDSVKQIAVLGQDSFPAVPAAGGSGYVQTFHSVSMLEGIAARFPGATVTYARGVKNVNHLALETQFLPAGNSAARGVTVEYFNTDFTGTPVKTMTQPSMTAGEAFNSDPEGKPDYSTWTLADIAPMLAPPADGKNQRWTGYLKVTTADQYHAFVQTGSQFRLSIDDHVLIDNSVIAKAALNQITLPLNPGTHKMVVELFGGGDFGGVTLRAGLVSRKDLVDPYALELAKYAEVVVIGAGFTSDNETEGSDRGFDLPIGQDELINDVTSVSKNVIVAITSGGSVHLPWLDKVSAVLELWYPGQEGGKALAELLAGDLSPSGRLPISWDKELSDNPSMKSYWFKDQKTQDVPYSEGVFVGYRGYDKENRAPLFPFGFGLGYSSFTYSDFAISALPGAATYRVSAKVKNTGKMAADDVVQLYVRDPHATEINAAEELKGFQRVSLQPGESKAVTFLLDARSFSHFDVAKHRWYAGGGSRDLLIGNNERDTPLRGTVTILDTQVQ